MKIVHYMQYGMTACMREGPPNLWPADHAWSSDWNEVTCEDCKEGRDLIHTYKISPDGGAITCLICQRTSYHPKDVQQKYCGACHIFHDDIWPPARAWCIKHGLSGHGRIHPDA